MEYRLDLSTLLLMLRQSTGSLEAEIQRMSRVKGHCRIFLRLERGSIESCSIINERSNEIFYGETAIKLIQNQMLEWHYQEEKDTTLQLRVPISRLPQEIPPRFALVPITPSLIPLRSHAILQSEFMTWPRLYRSVYSLIDGRTSVEDLVRLLSREQGLEKILGVIAHLQREDLIVFK